MAQRYPSVRPFADDSVVVPKAGGLMGVPDTLLHGIKDRRTKNKLTASHPLEFSEQNWTSNAEQMDFVMLRNTQGIHAPIRLQMERTTAAKVQRLPCLHSSNLMRDVLTGKLDTIDADDVFNNPAESEVMGQPHAMIEKQMGLL